jgi:hypothetical protein
MKLWRLLKIEGSVLIYIVHPLGPTYIGERRITFAKTHGLEVKCLYGEHVGEHIMNLGNISGTHYELRGNTVGTHKETRKTKKKSSTPSPTPPPLT